MFLFSHARTCLTACGLALAFAALVPSFAHAKTATASVETYVPPSPVTAQPGVLPEGVIWNKPLKAGDMSLQRKLPPPPKRSPEPPLLTSKALSPAATAPQPPLLSATKALAPTPKQAEAPQIASQANSTTGMMLLQGLKSALNKGGEGTAAPSRDGLPIKEMDGDKTPIAPQMKATASVKNQDEKQAAPVVVPVKDLKETFVAGQEPKAWGSPEASVLTDGKDVTVKMGDDGKMEIVFPPEKTAEAAKAPEDKKGLLARIVEPIKSSIFGDPVDENSPLPNAGPTASLPAGDIPFKVASAETMAKVASKSTNSMKGGALSPGCTPRVEKWTRECVDAGYPAHYVGGIIGETHVECPSGEAQDLWLSNTCAAPIASSPVAIHAKTDQGASASAPLAALEPSPPAPIDGSCGAANGLPAEVKPSTSLCAAGGVTDVSGEGPWRWSCKGIAGGMTVSCAAPVALGADGRPKTTTAVVSDAARRASETIVEDGSCGPSANVGTKTPPVGGLCAKGAPSAVNGSGPWTWACSGLNGGTAAACTAPKIADGVCGIANNVGADSMPVSGLCHAGYASAVSGNGPWSWTCNGLHGGTAANCQAPLRGNAVCGIASAAGQREKPTEGLCQIGKPSSVSGNGPWEWTCEGVGGGANVSCQAAVSYDGACGPAHGNQFSEAPSTGLCAAGQLSRVTGMGPWHWTCAGEKGGITVSCTAALGDKESIAATAACGLAAEALVFGKPKDNLCAAGKPSAVRGDKAPWSWSCADEAGHSVECSTLTASDGVCGKAADAPSAQPPAFDLCSIGTPGKINRRGELWTWACDGVLGGKETVCTAPVIGQSAMPIETKAAAASAEQVAATGPQCGPANGGVFHETPSAGLCLNGEAGKVHGIGPWMWTCGAKKDMVSCRAEKIINGTCGLANGSIQRSTPVEDLCSTGTPTPVNGTGPWLWSCVGAGGGASVSCSAAAQSQVRVDGTCGAATGSITTRAPADDLCDSGTPSTVYGEGPWTWTCSGANGGIASTCRAEKVLPKAPPAPGPIVNGVCGSSNGVAFVTRPRAGYCAAGTATDISGNGPWNWSCLGENGGMTVSCTAPLEPPAPVVGQCGVAHGIVSLTAPKSGLCSAGIAGTVRGKGPWTWTCSGTNGGGAASCVAPLAGKDAEKRGIPSSSTPMKAAMVRSGSSSTSLPEAPAPKAAPVGLVTPQLPDIPLPALKPGELPQLKPSGKMVPSKGGKDKVSVPMEDGTVLQTPKLDEKSLNDDLSVQDTVRDGSGDPAQPTLLVLDSDVSVITFDRGSSKLDDNAVEVAEALAKILKTHQGARITLTAYSDSGGDISPRNARKLSLARALAVREFLGIKGIPAARVDVRPMGANVPSGDADRVDVKVNP